MITTLANEAPSYYAFGTMLGERACDNLVSPELAYVAIRHARNTSQYNLVDGLASVYSDNSFMKPWSFPTRTSKETRLNAKAILSSIETAIDSSPPDWIRMELLLYLLALPHDKESDLEKAIEAAERFLISRKIQNEAIYRAYLHQAKAVRFLRQDPNAALGEWNLAIQCSKKADNMPHTIDLLSRLGNRMKETDADIAIKLLNEACIIADELDIMPLETFNILGLVAATSGQYDMALEAFLKAVGEQQKRGNPIYELAVNVANVCNNLGNHEEALEWARKAEGNIHAQVQLARALIALNRLDEALVELDSARERTLSVGWGGTLPFVDFGFGLYEFATGEYRNALETLHQAKKGWEDYNVNLHLGSCLVALARVELAIAENEGLERHVNTAGFWLEALAQYARERKYLGLLVEYLKLKAETRVLQGRLDDALDLLQQASTLSNRPSMRTQQKHIQECISELEHAQQ
ncbi:MAG: hypothetical protein EAX81_07395 [Candidatus Thorarchaeota archaeon]|nr:hypothetical protein [Candidatus Thorarchaeota archaeon]